jgi:hypothetical protein
MLRFDIPLWRNKLMIALAAFTLLCACQTVNDAVVRRWHMDSGLSRRAKHQIEEGLKKREMRPPRTGREMLAPEFIDEG